MRRSSLGVDFRPAVLIGGLGVGFSLVEAVAEPRWGRIVVAEREQAVIDWHLRGPLAELTGPALADPRTQILHTDLVAYLRGPSHDDADRAAAPSSHHDADEHGFASRSEEPPVPTRVGEAIAPSDSCTFGARRRGAGQRYDALCLDIDNGPDWTVTEDNGGLYSPAGLAACRERLNPGGVLAIWSAQPSAAFEEALRNAGFTSVRTEEITVARGVPDVVHLAIRGA
ncbi:spermidine synthase [Streptomyces buecherae]|uniref:spermidine synthase n=1 Tax=Streptomyces buecherae TaxID=2763006 RepID=UPI003F540B7E